MKLLLIDIETAPNLAYTWGLWNQNVGTNMLIESGYMLSWAAKWYGEDKVYYYGLNNSTKKQMVRAAHKMLTEADAVIHFNGTKFDVPHLNREFILEGLTPPAPYKQIDLIKTCRQQFKFPSNKMAYVLKALDLGEKADTGGFETWVGCMNGDKDAWKKMETYNIEDVMKLEELYERLKPWIKGHANQNLYRNERSDEQPICPTCAGTSFQRRGYSYTAAYRFPRYRCKTCGSWFRGGKAAEGPKPESKFIGIGA